jgi:hypothetical protein
VSIDPRIQQRFEQNAAAHKAAAAEITGELSARKQEVAERARATKEEFARLGKALVEVREEQVPQPARRVEDNDISAKAEAYQEPDEDAPAPIQPPQPAPAPKSDYEEDVPSFHWDDDPRQPPAPEPAPAAVSARPVARAKRPAREVEEDLSDRDWLE